MRLGISLADALAGYLEVFNACNYNILCYAHNMKKTSVELTCPVCAKKYQMHQYRIDKGTGKYCSQSCYLAARWKKSDNCEQCKKPIKGKQQRFCNERCRKDYWNSHSFHLHKHASIWRRKLALIKELGSKCVSCGFSDIRALQINHIDPSTKIRASRDLWSWSRRFKDWEANKGNLELLCANCHSLHTWEQRGFGPKDGILDK